MAVRAAVQRHVDGLGDFTGLGGLPVCARMPLLAAGPFLLILRLALLGSYPEGCRLAVGLSLEGLELLLLFGDQLGAFAPKLLRGGQLALELRDLFFGGCRILLGPSLPHLHPGDTLLGLRQPHA